MLNAVPDPLRPMTGDAHLALLAALDMCAPLGDTGPVPAAFSPDSDLRSWEPASAAPVARDLRGSLTYGEVELREVLAVLELRPAGLAALQVVLRDALPDGVDGSRFALQGCEALVLVSGALSLRLHVTVSDGWESGDVLRAFGPERRDEVCDALRADLLPLLAEVHEAAGAEEPLDLAYFHLMYAGAAAEAARAGGAADLRRLVYPPSAAPLSSQSPRQEEFVFLGYAFSLVVVEGADAGDRLRELSRLVGLCSVVFRRFERVCDAVEATLREQDGTCDRPSLLRLEERVQVQYEGLVAPTFSYRHELLVMREALLREWQADRLAVRSRTLLALLGARAGRLDQEQGARVARKLELLLFAVAAMSVFSVATDAQSLSRSGSWVLLALVSVLFIAVMAYAVRGMRR